MGLIALAIGLLLAGIVPAKILAVIFAATAGHPGLAMSDPGATLLLLSFGPSRWRPLVGGASLEEVQTAFAGWETLTAEPGAIVKTCGSRSFKRLRAEPPLRVVRRACR